MPRCLAVITSGCQTVVEKTSCTTISTKSSTFAPPFANTPEGLPRHTVCLLQYAEPDRCLALGRDSGGAARSEHRGAHSGGAHGSLWLAGRRMPGSDSCNR